MIWRVYKFLKNGVRTSENSLFYKGMRIPSKLIKIKIFRAKEI